MDELYVEIEISTENGETEILITSSGSFGKSSPLNHEHHHGKLKLHSQTYHRELTEERILRKEAAALQAIRDLTLPVYAKDGNTYIAGMCAVCRELVAGQNCSERRKLLGFKEACLLAPAESSIWTRFCEVHIVEAIEHLLKLIARGCAIYELPKEVPRFERHMNEPVRMHNIYKLAREQASRQQNNEEETDVENKNNNKTAIKGKKKRGKIIINCTTPKERLPIEHRFAEGVAFTIADLILYPCFRLIFQCCGGMLEYFPLINTWLSEIDVFDPSCARTLHELYPQPTKTANVDNPLPALLRIPDCEDSSLYKSDPKRYKPRNRIYTEQSEVDAAIDQLQSLRLEFNSDCDTVYHHNHVDWTVIEPKHEKSSALPPERLVRKRQQLENLANAVAALAAPSDCIVDFCSGTGHLGILLALQLPQCTVILMENKAISLERAKQRAISLQLSNCRFYQCNIDYFEGPFNIGTSLHACGTATDIVLQQCRRSRAKFVCCPCCYGALQPMPHINYPLSARFRSVLNEQAYLHIAHTADQAHELGTLNCRPETTRQGQLCMDIVDTDRKLQAEEAGYKVTLTRLKPEQCTPKNRLLVGHLVEQS